jgi:hypothetical protein
VTTRRVPPAIVTQGTTGYQAVQMHMAPQLLAPGVEHRGHTQLSAEPFGIRTEGLERGPNCLEQQPVDQLRVQLYPGIEIVRQGEHQVVVGHRQDRLALLVTPGLRRPPLTLGAVAVTTGAIPRLLVVTVIAVQL